MIGVFEWAASKLVALLCHTTFGRDEEPGRPHGLQNGLAVATGGRRDRLYETTYLDSQSVA
jgi:hypothetical protein